MIFVYSSPEEGHELVTETSIHIYHKNGHSTQNLPKKIFIALRVLSSHLRHAFRWYKSHILAPRRAYRTRCARALTSLRGTRIGDSIYGRKTLFLRKKVPGTQSIEKEPEIQRLSFFRGVKPASVLHKKSLNRGEQQRHFFCFYGDLHSDRARGCDAAACCRPFKLSKKSNASRILYDIVASRYRRYQQRVMSNPRSTSVALLSKNSTKNNLARKRKIGIEREREIMLSCYYARSPSVNEIPRKPGVVRRIMAALGENKGTPRSSVGRRTSERSGGHKSRTIPTCIISEK
ncbi:unnamed protein product [Trichogramma brassicae]|uniref:Uncharacterized protein n=1 Tax=Trichogramma brassicae TaxID=86971 RepID=A0A6H5IF34_9HYME|nr:unnamed protein product [Trichogramma brassicae]